MIRPGVYDVRRQSGLNLPPEAPTKINFIIGSSKRGPLNKITVGDVNTIQRKFESGDIVNFCLRAYANGASSFHVVSVKGSGALQSTKTFKKGETNILVIKAINEGVWGDSIKIMITETVTGTRNLFVSYNGDVKGSVMAQTSLDNLVSSINNHPLLSEYIIASKQTEETTDFPDVTTDWTALAGGADGDAVTNSDIVGEYDPETGLRTGLELAKVDQDWFNIAVATLEGDATINAALITLCENRNYGKAILTHLSSDTDEEIITAAGSLTSPNGRASFWAGYYESYFSKNEYVSPVAAVMGILCKNEVFVSPSNYYIVDALSLKKDYDNTQVEEFLLHQINSVARGYRDSEGRFIRSIHSMNITTDPDLTEIQFTGTYDRINREMRDAMNWATSKPNTKELRRQLNGSMELVKHRCLNEATKYGPGIVVDMWVKCDETNNPQEVIAAKQCICDWGVLFIGAAHYIVNRSTVSPSSIESTITREVII